MRRGGIMKKVSEAEFSVLEIMWEENRELTLSDFMECFSKKNITWAQTTVSTYIARLVKKKMISCNKKGKLYRYLPNYTKKEYQQLTIKADLKKKLNTSLDELVLTFAGKSITQENLENIRKFLKEIEE